MMVEEIDQAFIDYLGESRQVAELPESIHDNVHQLLDVIVKTHDLLYEFIADRQYGCNSL
jgi:hypothetical protein